jgi:hypothetical protein
MNSEQEESDQTIFVGLAPRHLDTLRRLILTTLYWFPNLPKEEKKEMEEVWDALRAFSDAPPLEEVEAHHRQMVDKARQKKEDER